MAEWPAMAGEPRLGRGKRVLFGAIYLLILASATAACILAVERWAARYVELPGTYLSRHARLNHISPPDSRLVLGEIAGLDPDFPEPPARRYNAQGWAEDHDIAEAKPPGVFRIFYVGDSFVMGYVPEDEAMPRLVEKELNRDAAPGGRRFEVVNTGTPSYSPTLEYILIRYYLARYAPDLIVLNVDMTDDYDDWVYRHSLIVDADGNPYAVPASDAELRPFVNTAGGAVEPGWLLRLKLFLYERSRIYNLLLARARRSPRWIEAARRDADRLAGETGSPAALYGRCQWASQREWDARTAEAARFTLDNVGRIAEFCRASGIRLLVTGVPHYLQFPPAPGATSEWTTRPHQELERVAREKGVAYFDGVAALAGQIAGTPQNAYYLRGDMHFNPRGNRLWAQAHLRALRDPALGLLPAER